MIRMLLDANINGSVATDNLNVKGFRIFSFYDLNIRRHEKDDVVAKIANSHDIKTIITDEPTFASETGQEWRKIKGFSLIIPSDPIVRIFRAQKHDRTSKDLLKQLHGKLKEADSLRPQYFIFEILQNPLYQGRLELFPKQARHNDR